MTDRTNVQRTAAINFLTREIAKNEGIPLGRLYAHAASYSDATARQVRAWWEARGR